MGEGMIVRRGGSGGARLRVLAAANAAALPKDAKDGTIGFLSNTAAGVVYAQAAQPTGAAQGDVWVKTGTRSIVPVDIAKKGTLMVYPLMVFQLSEGVWTERDMYMHTNGAWQALALALYHEGEEVKDITGGWKHYKGGTYAKYEDRVRVSAGTSAYSKLTTENAIDITRYTRLVFVGADAPDGVAAPNSMGYAYFGLSTTKDRNIGNHYKTVAPGTTVLDGDVLTFDISGYTGAFYIFATAYNSRRFYFSSVRLLQ